MDSCAISWGNFYSAYFISNWCFFRNIKMARVSSCSFLYIRVVNMILLDYIYIFFSSHPCYFFCHTFIMSSLHLKVNINVLNVLISHIDFPSDIRWRLSTPCSITDVTDSLYGTEKHIVSFEKILCGLLYDWFWSKLF